MRRGFVAQRLHDITAPEKCQLVEKQASYEIVRPYRYVRGGDGSYSDDGWPDHSNDNGI